MSETSPGTGITAIGTVPLTDDLTHVAAALREGHVVALPTDTVYGFGASLAHPNAIQAIFRLKGRPEAKPLPILLADESALTLVTDEAQLDHRARLLARRFWPGPLTIVVPARPDLPAAVRAIDGTVGVRVPDHNVTQRILALAGGAAAVTSANRSGEPPLTSARAVAERFGNHPKLAVISTGEMSGGSTPSTVIGFAHDEPFIIRAGTIELTDIIAVWQSADPHA